MSSVRCQRPLGERHDLVRHKFRCLDCHTWVCAACEGTASGDPVADKLCDPCWAKRERRKATARRRLGALGARL